MFKQCKKIYNKFFGYTGTIKTHNEKAKNSDPEIKQFIRSKRLPKNLPDSFTDTKWIKRDKSWKSRCRKEKQWIRHKKSEIEEEILDMESTAIHDLFYKYGDGEWYDIPDLKLVSQLEKQGIAEIQHKEREIVIYTMDQDSNGKYVFGKTYRFMTLPFKFRVIKKEGIKNVR